MSQVDSCVTYRLRHGLNGLVTPQRRHTITFEHPACSPVGILLRQMPQFISQCLLFWSHLTMKSNSEPASMRTPNKVEKAPSSTGANMCSSASTARLWRSPMAVRNAYNTHTKTSFMSPSPGDHRLQSQTYLPK